ncbi:PstS family phosphate ABC transporter substrate-binding protein [Pelomonas sp. KK5]|uniref:PstS family phosphate ABC transporter substrate-binding protein n=1 Tax=Pelomonas sp. KK5 TaxID=1855730 RepID=UPI00097CB285|nr:substrate-binding domain-containing protein [Pelomonas sp. KK5]
MKQCIALGLLACTSLASVTAIGQSSQSQPTEESRKLPVGSHAERKARMAARANSQAYTKQFDLSGLPHYAPEAKVSGTLRLCGNNYVGDSPLGGYWKAAFEKLQPGVTVEMNLETAATAIPCLYFDKADIGINHDPGFYDSLAHLRLKGFEPLGISVFTGSYDYVGWQNNMVIFVNKDNPLTKITLQQLDGIFGAVRDGGWIGTVWHPEFARGADKNIRSWGQMGLSGEWSSRHITPHGYDVSYATAVEFSRDVLQSSNRWNGDLHAYANFRRPDGTVYLEADQIFDQVRKDPGAIGYARFHHGFPKDIKILPVARDDNSPAVPYTLETLQDRSYPLWGDQSFWVSVKAGQKMDPKVREFIRFVLSQEGQALVQKDGKYLPLTAAAAKAGLDKLANY